MSGFNLKVALMNVGNFKRQLELMDAGTRQRTIDAIDRGTRAVVAKGRARAPKRSGELAGTVRAEFSKNKLVGYAKVGFGKLLRKSRAGTTAGLARAKERREKNRYKLALAGTSIQAMSVIDLGVYAPVVERGDKKRNKPAKPFMYPSLAEEKPGIMQELGEAPLKAAKGAGLK
jgi:hypothetical protein